MRSQEKAIIAAVENGAFDARAAFMSKAELIEVTARVGALIGCRTSKFDRLMVDTWLKTGALPEPVRTERNRLFSTVDVFSAVAVLSLSNMGVPLKTCRGAITVLVEKWLSENFLLCDPIAAASELQLNVPQFLVLSTTADATEITWLDSVDELVALSKRSGSILLFNAALSMAWTSAACGEKWKEKASKLLAKVEVVLANSKSKGNK